MFKQIPPLVVIQDPAPRWAGGLSFGMDGYSSRSLFMRAQDTAVVTRSKHETAFHKYMAGMHYGPIKVISMAHSREISLIEALINDKITQKLILAALMERPGSKILFFDTTELEVRLVEEELKLDWDKHCLNLKPAHRDTLNCKTRNREAYPDLYPPHRICRNTEEIGEAWTDLALHGLQLQGIHPNLASGDGHKDLNSYGEALDFWEMIKQQGATSLIIDTKFSGVISLSAVFCFNDGNPISLGMTKQLVKDETEHCGNVIAINGAELSGITPEDKQNIWRCARDVIASIDPTVPTLVGCIGVDLIKDVNSSKIYATEVNARVTASFYPFAFISQMKTNKPRVILTKKVDANGEFNDLESIRTALEDLGIQYDKEREIGVIPYFLDTLPGQFRVMCIAGSEDNAMFLLETLQERVTSGSVNSQSQEPKKGHQMDWKAEGYGDPSLNRFTKGPVPSPMTQSDDKDRVKRTTAQTRSEDYDDLKRAQSGRLSTQS